MGLAKSFYTSGHAAPPIFKQHEISWKKNMKRKTAENILAGMKKLLDSICPCGECPIAKEHWTNECLLEAFEEMACPKCGEVIDGCDAGGDACRDCLVESPSCHWCDWNYDGKAKDES